MVTAPYVCFMQADKKVNNIHVQVYFSLYWKKIKSFIYLYLSNIKYYINIRSTNEN